ncbi:uncharacterized protein [Watersipora subatra]|uniref:uncharacterized protein n=1 Tax=Watersipora subatra TaxID=2589382 RepID=UPI00355C56D7
MELLQRSPGFNCILILSAIVYINADTPYTMLPDEDKRVVSGSISCNQTYRIIISSLNYYTQTSTPCNISCPPVSGGYLDGSNTVCQNENVIRSSCYARNSCQLSNLPLPEDRCGSSDTVGKVKVYYHCVHKDLVFNLCERRALIVEEEAQIIFTTPLSSQQTMSKSRCECSIRSRYPNWLIGSAVNITRQRMAQLLDEHSLVFMYATTKITVATSYSRLYLSPKRVFPVGVYTSPEVIIKYDNRENQDIYSKVFLTIEPAKNLMISCNEAEVSKSVASTPQMTTQQTSKKSQHGESSAASSIISRTTVSPATTNIECHPDSSPTKPAGKTSDSDSPGKASEGDKKPLNTIVAVVVSVAIIFILCIIVVAVIYILKRNRRRRAEKHVANASENNNVDLPLLHLSAPEPIAENVYHELEEQNDRNENDSSDADPYKVTPINTLSPPPGEVMLREGRAAANRSRNSRGSIANITENSYISEGTYAEPCDVLPNNLEEDSSHSRQYDTPAEVTYTPIMKRAKKTDSVELIENDLYGS